MPVEVPSPVDAPPEPVEAVRCPEEPGLCFRVVPPDTEIVLNGESMGPVGALAGNGGFLALEAGFYQITLRRAGYATWRAEVAIRSRVETIEVDLKPRP